MTPSPLRHPVAPILLVVAAVLSLPACGIDSSDPVDAGPAPSRVAPSTSTTTAQVNDSRRSIRVSLYLTKGSTIVPVSRTVPASPGIGFAAVQALLGAPTPDEAAAELGTSVPPGTTLIGLTIEMGLATVELSNDFESGGTNAERTARLAQVTCTLDQFDTVNRVRFALAGELVGVLDGNGSVTDRPVSCQTYRRQLRDR